MAHIFIHVAAASALLAAGGISAGWAQVKTVKDPIPYESVTESERLYQEDRAETIRGVVESLDTVTMREGAPFRQLRLKTGDDTLVVHLGPQWFMEQQVQRLQLDVGREVEVQGSRETVNGKPVLVAAEIRNDRRDEQLRLRHPSGVPVWAGSEYMR
ncbi:MAG: hypothetical protein K0S45_3288 [Nitrospira sp.]|jgi:hypothetical protein|nr:hypothetical protein [Nitrospira sp.]